jgi:hypothetical protein
VVRVAVAVVLLFLTRPAAAIEVVAPETGCPSRAQVVAALEVRGVGQDGGQRLEVARSAGEVVVRLRDESGGLALERRLRLEDRAAPEGCEALAEAAALVVTRHLREIGYRPPAAVVSERPAVVVSAPVVTAPATPSAGLLGVTAGGRVGAGSGNREPRGEMMLELAVHRSWLVLEVGGGASSETTVAVPDTTTGALRLRAFPLRAAVGVAIDAPGGALVPSLGLAVDVLSFRAAGLVDARAGTRVEPAAELGLSYLAVTRHVFGRLRLTGGVSLAPRDFDAGRAEPVFRTPAAHLRAQIEIGLVLWKNGGRTPL